MRKLFVLLFAVIVILTIEWPTALTAGAGQSTAVKRNVATEMLSVDADAVRKEFNASSDKVRIVALLSPTCPMCRSGHGIVGQVLEKFSSPRLQAILVWEPMREGDGPVIAAQQADTIHDARIFQGWNKNRSVGKLFGETLGLHEIAWDVYLIYKPGIKWEGRQPPSPSFWMHQLQSADPKLLLCENPTRLSAEVGKLLDQSH